MIDYQEVVKYFENKLNTGVNRNRRKYYKTAISAMQELQEYKQLGTLEEVREAVEKQRKVKPEDGEYCPICHTFLKDEDDVLGFYCMNCGQAIDWGEEE